MGNSFVYVWAVKTPQSPIVFEFALEFLIRYLQLRMQNCSGEKPRQILQQIFIFLDVYSYLGMRF